jgi:ribonuclease-3
MELVQEPELYNKKGLLEGSLSETLEIPLNELEQLEPLDLSKPHVSREQVEKIILMKPKNIDLYRRALVHKSLQKNVRECISLGLPVCDYMKESNERLEFLGDAVFNLVVGHYLFDKYPDKDEGFLTRMRTKIVRSAHCVKFAKILELGQFIITGNKIIRIKDQDGTVINNKVLEDSFEAFIGALYLDLGFKYAEMFIKKLVSEHVTFDELLYDDNYKDILMRYSQTYNYELPIYKTISIEGPPHNRIFTVKTYLKSKNNPSVEREIGTGTGSSKKNAEQDSARHACSLITNLKHITNRDL